MAKLLQMPLLFDTLVETALAETAPSRAVPGGAPLTPASEEPLSSPVPGVADAHQRSAALDIHRSWVVEAPAGSGKTGLLIQRFLKLLAFGSVERPDEILAITFTRKADAEMRHRILAQLAAADAAQPLPATASPFDRSTRALAEAALARDRDLGWHLLANPRQLNIRTIDSFCAELAGSLPLTAGAGGRYSPTDDAAPLYQLAAERTLLSMGTDAHLSDDLKSLLLHRDADPNNFIALLADMLRNREQWGELIPLDRGRLSDEFLTREVLPHLNATLQRLIGRELAQVSEVIGPALLTSLASLAHELSQCPGADGNPNPLKGFADSPRPPAPKAEDLALWRCLPNLLLTSSKTWRAQFNKNQLRLEASKPQREALLDLVAAFQVREEAHPSLRSALRSLCDLPEATYPDEQWQVVKSLHRVLHQALLELQILFAERQTCDFTEVSLNARTLLQAGAEADLLGTSVGRLRHMLVDEMQDTSAGQYQLLEAVTAGWDGSAQTLFLVGDPKQSIYEFRLARVERFRRVMLEGRFGSLAVSALHLTANFRSQACLVDDFNRVFETIFPAPDSDADAPGSADVPFIAASPTRPPGQAPALHWQLTETAPSRTPETSDRDADSDSNNDEAAAPSPMQEARSVRSTIEDFLAGWPGRGLPRAPRIAVLARTRGHLAPIIQEFHQDRGHGRLPFRAIDVESLQQRPEILDLLALTRALLHPDDRIACLAVLRSPVCGLDLADLLALVGDATAGDATAGDATTGNTPESLATCVATRQSLLSEQGRQRLQRAWHVLEHAQGSTGRTALSTHVERTWRSLGGDASLQPHEQRNARRFLDLLHALETGPEPVTLSALLRRLTTLYAEPSAPEAAVELMTIHKAKGLEWDLVCVPSLQLGSSSGSASFLKWLEFDTTEGLPEFLLAPIQGKGETAYALFQWLDRRQKERERAEVKRLFYVACTRAREELHLFGAVARNAEGSLKSPLRTDSLLYAAWPAVPKTLLVPTETSASPAQILPFRAPNTAPEPTIGLSLAAAEQPGTREPGPALGSPAQATPPAVAPLYRLPLAFDPLAHLASAGAPQLAYPAAASLRTQALFTRPEGSFAARAFGNTVHRFVELLASKLDLGTTPDVLQTEVDTWLPRLLATLRSEGLSPAQAATDARRAQQALRNILSDPTGAWILSPHEEARSEAYFAVAGDAVPEVLRADRTFLGGPAVHATGSTHLWIVDYKTTELGGRDRESFLADQRAKYAPQMSAYAKAATAAGRPSHTIILALYFPLLPALLHWNAAQEGV